MYSRCLFAQSANTMVEEDVSKDRHGLGHWVNEQTPLLDDINAGEHNHLSSSYSGDSTLQDDESIESDIDHVEFDNFLTRAQSIGHGTEPEAQGNLRRPRKQNIGRRKYQAERCTNGKQRSVDSFDPIFRAGIDEETDTEDMAYPRSRYLASVSEPQFWLIFASLTISYFVSCFDGAIMVSSHPVITSYFHGANSASWLSTVFLLTSTTIQPLFGRLSDAVGRKCPYIGSVVIFLIGTLWCALAGNITSFIVARAFCGLGAGGMMAIGAIIMSDLVPIDIRGAYQSYMNVVFGVGGASGAALGGAIADSWGWQWEFWIQLPFLVVCLCLALWTIPDELGIATNVEKSFWEAMKTFDYMGSALLTTAITSLILGLNLGENVFEWSHPFIISSLVIFAISLPVHLGRNPSQGPNHACISNTIGAICVNAIAFNLPLYFQAVLLESATTSGLRLIIPTVVASVIGFVTGFLITWTKRLKWLLVAGSLFLVLGGIALSVMYRGLPTWLYIMCIIPSSIGQGFMMPATFMAVLVVSEQAEQAVVTSTLMLWKSLGFILGVAMSSLVLQNFLISNLDKNVTGPNKEVIIRRVRESVQAIIDIDPVARQQVINAYSASLRATFILAAVLAIITVLITIPLKVPGLGHKKG